MIKGKYDYVEYKDSFGKKHSGYYSENKVEEIFENKNNIIKVYIGSFNYKTVEELREDIKKITGRKPKLIE